MFFCKTNTSQHLATIMAREKRKNSERSETHHSDAKTTSWWYDEEATSRSRLVSIQTQTIAMIGRSTILAKRQNCRCATVPPVLRTSEKQNKSDHALFLGCTRIAGRT
jgi:hypothetical protein